MAECIFDCACQVPFVLKDTLALIQFLKANCQLTVGPSSTNSLPATKPSSIETSYLYLLMSLLYSFDCGYIENKEKGMVYVKESFKRQLEICLALFIQLD